MLTTMCCRLSSMDITGICLINLSSMCWLSMGNIFLIFLMGHFLGNKCIDQSQNCILFHLGNHHISKKSYSKNVVNNMKYIYYRQNMVKIVGIDKQLDQINYMLLFVQHHIFDILLLFYYKQNQMSKLNIELYQLLEYFMDTLNIVECLS